MYLSLDKGPAVKSGKDSQFFAKAVPSDRKLIADAPKSRVLWRTTVGENIGELLHLAGTVASGAAQANHAVLFPGHMSMS